MRAGRGRRPTRPAASTPRRRSRSRSPTRSTADIGYAYLFKDTSGLDPAAGQDYVDYEFNLTNGPYKTGAYNPTNTTPGNGMNFGPRPGDIVRDDRQLPARLHRPLVRQRAADHARLRDRRRHPRPPRRPVRRRRCLVCSHPGHLPSGRGRLHRQHRRPRARDPRLRRRQLRPARPAPAHLLRRPRGHQHVPARPPDPGRGRLLRLQRGTGSGSRTRTA